ALLRGGRGDTLLWEAHQDTVSGAGMTVQPFAAKVREDRVYGRGACDVKGPLAAMLVALASAAPEPARNRPNVLMACTVNEECGFSGARALADIWRREPADQSPISLIPTGGLTLDELRSLRPTAAIIAEPTELNVVVAHRGVVRWQCVVHGRAAHSSRPEDGANAIYAMAPIVGLIDRYHRDVLATRPADPQCGPPTACVTTIQGGTGANTVPDRAIIDVDRRLTPAEEPAAAYEELVSYLSNETSAGECRVEHLSPWMQSRGLTSADNRRWAERLSSMAAEVGINSQTIGVPFGTNAASIAAAGIPSVVFGPGSIAQAHTADEWIAIDELQRAVSLFHRIATGAISADG
ncbi:MAG TPA: M20/M25/M40 family metallo-hydrolase, partial [Lacipirellula sp.]